MNKTNKILLSVLIILAAAVLAFTAIYLWQRGDFKKSYYAVYLDTGDLYFGELSNFPYLSLSNVWYLQRDSQGATSLSKFIKAPWGPEDKIKLNKDKVVWIAKISDASGIMPYITGQKNISGISSGGTGQPSSGASTP